MIAWGDTNYGQSTIAPDLSEVVGLAAGQVHSLALKADGTVEAWGYGGDGRTSVPAGLSAVVAVAAGNSHNLALRINGTVVAWGLNDYGQSSVPAGLTNVIAVSGGVRHSLALKADGTVWAWGDNGQGQTNVPAGLSNVVKIAAGANFSVALKSDGSVLTWGSSYAVPAGLSNVAAIAAGSNHSLALMSNGCVIAWGVSGPMIGVPAGLSNVVAVAAGAEHSVALKDDGTIVVFGGNGYNQLDIPAGLTNVVSIAAGVFHTLALRANSAALPEGLVCSSNGIVFGTPVLAGTNRVTFAVSDALGATSTKPLEIVILPHANTRPAISSNSPPVVAIDLAEGGGSQLFQIWANDPEGSNLTYSWTWDGVAVGSNASTYRRTTSWGGLGLHFLRCTVSDDFWSNYVSVAWAVTVQDIPLEIRTTALPAGEEAVPYNQRLEVTNGIAPYTWRLGVTELPAGLSFSTNGVVSGMPSLAVTSAVTFIVEDSVRTITSKTLEIAIAPNSNLRPAVTLTAPSSSDFSLNEGGASRLCQVWANDPEGSNLTYSWTWDGQPVGVNTSAYTRTTSWEGPGLHALRCYVSDGVWSNIVFAQWAVTVVDFPIKIMTSSLTGCPPLVPYSTVLQATNGAVPYIWSVKAPVVGWGFNGSGAIDVPDELSRVVALACGDYHSLALQSDGRVIAWGNNDSQQTDVPSGLSNVVAIAAGKYFNMALQSNGTVVVWGEATDGQTNMPPDLTNVVGIAAGGYHCLARQGNGRVVAWGYNDEGATDVPSNLTAVAAIAAGAYHSLALQSNGTVVAWGYDGDGQTNVPPGLSNVVALAGGDCHSLALQSNGTVVAWGYGDDGATDVPPGLSNVVALAGGGVHSLALQSNGTVVAWGGDGDGQISLPTDLAPAQLIAAGGSHSLALLLGARELPPGLTCSSSGLLAGTPATAGIHTMTVMVEDQLGARTNKTLILVIGPDRATNNVPTWWLAQHGLTNFNVDAMQDLDGDGLLNWQEWVAGCDPSDIRSVFGMTGAGRAAGQNMVLRWPSIPDRVYDLSSATNLLAGQNAFTPLAGATNLPATPPENVYTTSVQNVGPCFYRIGVRE